MEHYTLRLELGSPALIGSGEGFGAVIDTDIVFDDVGIPFVPAKRIKGCLLDAAMEVEDMFKDSAVNFSVQIGQAFGKRGAEKPAPVYFSNLTIEDYEKNKEWLEYFLKTKEYDDVVSRDRILETFTGIRQQTKIGSDGVADDHSLRTIRVVRKSTVFLGDVRIEDNDETILNTLILACMNFRRIGTKRNRGFGDVRCTLLDSDEELSIETKLEEICTS
ncbi:MAG: hypothetical protein DRI57_16315 [Deltaproteobacteria bacterium]|nr:MAG: hypothetical protein DRI57_16315 [Deltaproteobacteria bacterium]